MSAQAVLLQAQADQRRERRQLARQVTTIGWRLAGVSAAVIIQHFIAAISVVNGVSSAPLSCAVAAVMAGLFFAKWTAWRRARALLAVFDTHGAGTHEDAFEDSYASISWHSHSPLLVLVVAPATVALLYAVMGGPA